MEKIPQFHHLKIRFIGDTFATVERFSNTEFLRCIALELHSKSDFVLTTVTPRKMSFASRFSKSKERKKKKIDVVSVFYCSSFSFIIRNARRTKKDVTHSTRFSSRRIRKAEPQPFKIWICMIVDKRAVVLQKVVIQKLHDGLPHQGFQRSSLFFHKKVCIAIQ